MDTTSKVIEELSLSDLKGEYYIIKNALSNVQLELDKKNQELHDCKRLLKIAEVLEKEYQQEIGILQKNDNEENLKLKSTVKKLEANLVESKHFYSEQILHLETELTVKRNEIKQLQDELKEEISKQKSKDDVDVLKNDIDRLKNELEELHGRNSELVEENENLRKRNFALEEQLVAVSTENNNLKESLQVKREEVTDANQLISTLQEEMAVIRNEMETLQQKPLNANSKGNSLFAEVDDRRVELQNIIKHMKTKYTDLKNEYNKIIKQVHSLREKNIKLKECWDADASEAASVDKCALEAYRSRIAALEAMVKSYKNTIDEKQKEANSSCNCDFDFLESLIERKRQEIESLRQELNSQSLKLIYVTQDLKSTASELRKVKLENIGLQEEIDKIKGDAELIKSESIFEKLLNSCEEEISVGKEENDDIPIKNYTQNIDFSRRKKSRSFNAFAVTEMMPKEDDKENFKITHEIKTESNSSSTEQDEQNSIILQRKKVTILENATNEEKKIRKGAKLIKTNPIFITTNKK